MQTLRAAVIWGISLIVSGCGAMPVPKVSGTKSVENPPVIVVKSNPAPESSPEILDPKNTNKKTDTVRTSTVLESDTLDNLTANVSKLTVEDYIAKAVELLNDGKIAQAVVALQSALKLENDNVSATDLLVQINETPETYFTSKSFFEYKIRAGDSLASLAQRFLNNPMQFHMLGKLNDIYNIAQLKPGDILRIPDNNQLSVSNPVNKKPKQDSKLQSGNSSTPTTAFKAQEIYDRAKHFYDDEAYESVISILARPDVEILNDHRIRDLLVLTYTRYANVLASKAELLEAQAVLEKAISMMPNNQDLRRQLAIIKGRRDIDGHMQAAIKLYQEGKSDKAYKLFLKVLDLDPAHKQAREHVVTIKAKDIDIFYKDGMQHYRRQELRQAIELWDKVLLINPNHELAKLYRARAVELKKRIDQL